MQCCVFKCQFGFCATDGQRNVDLMNRWLLELPAGTLGKKQFRRRHIFTFLLLLSTKCKEATVQSCQNATATENQKAKRRHAQADEGVGAGLLKTGAHVHAWPRSLGTTNIVTRTYATEDARSCSTRAKMRVPGCTHARTRARMKEKTEMQHRCGSKVRDGRRPGR